MTDASRYTNTIGAAAYLACSATYLEKRRARGDGPRYLKIGKAVRYAIEELDAFARAKEHGSTAEYARGVSAGSPAMGVGADGQRP